MRSPVYDGLVCSVIIARAPPVDSAPGYESGTGKRARPSATGLAALLNVLDRVDPR